MSLDKLEKHRQRAVDEYKNIAEFARANRGFKVGENTGTLTMIFGAAAMTGILIYKDPTFANTVGASLTLIISVRANTKLQKSIKLKSAKFKQMVVIADRERRKLEERDLQRDSTPIFHPEYEVIHDEAFKYVTKNKKSILRKTNHRVIRNAMKNLGLIGVVAAAANYTENNGITNFENTLKFEFEKRCWIDNDPNIPTSPLCTSQRPKLRPR